MSDILAVAGMSCWQKTMKAYSAVDALMIGSGTTGFRQATIQGGCGLSVAGSHAFLGEHAVQWR